ncbi:alkaline phosphatase family protein [Algoriphagus sp. H41]|uniref:Alkaline phosphatase family protein n=1 Tax=Algoriphagus oliviformis TaxID=2811231 RepID=A0ABS3C4H9_9BACT|nr:alkaline phosphatase PafA [Algoriphagus oliviformis]MBN7811770.1 alkaline phosphatase family protein [Algoriphagus oliviformis]
MRKFLAIALLALSPGIFAHAQTPSEKPKLVVGIIVDQMRQEYLYRFADRYTEGGFKRMMKEGFMMTNGHYNYAPTVTGPGHTSVYTGTTPATHGIISNSWYDRKFNKYIYCAEDSTVTNVGGTPENGQISPRNLLTTTVTDELRFATGKRSKVVGIAIKDRGASLPAGHTGDAYWYDDANGDFMTSTYYYETLPQWVADFNAKKVPDSYLSQTWETLFPLDSYVNSIDDNNDFEGVFIGKESPTFPYQLDSLRGQNGGYGLIASTPYGNSMTLDFALAAIEGEKLGQRGVTDFLAVSFSSPDYIGHRFGPASVEVEDNYLRLDREFERMFNYLDKAYGKGQYLVFLSADHAVADVATYMVSENVPAGNINTNYIFGQISGYCNAKYGQGDWILKYTGDQVFLNRTLAEEKNVDFVAMQRDLANFMLRFNGIKEVYTAEDMRTQQFTYGRAHLLQMGYNHKASGDLLLVFEPAWMVGGARGTTHGSPYNYDTNVPILFFGWGVKAGSSSRKASITDIAPTVSALLKIKYPNAADGEPIFEIVDGK